MQLNELHITCKPLGYIGIYAFIFHIKKISFYQKIGKYNDRFAAVSYKIKVFDFEFLVWMKP